MSDVNQVASDLTAKLAYIQQYQLHWNALQHQSARLMEMIDQNTTGDRSAYDALNMVHELATTKSAKCEAWLGENRPKLDRLMVEILGGDL